MARMKKRQAHKILFVRGGSCTQRTRAWETYWYWERKITRRWSKAMKDVCERLRKTIKGKI